MLKNPKVHCPVQHSLTLLPVLRQKTTAHALPLSFTKLHFNINLPSTPRSCKLSLYFRFSFQTPVRIYLLPPTCSIPSSCLWQDRLYYIRLANCFSFQYFPINSAINFQNTPLQIYSTSFPILFTVTLPKDAPFYVLLSGTQLQGC